MIKSKWKLKLNHNKLHKDVLCKLKTLGKSQRWFTERTGLSRTQLQNLRQGDDMQVTTFIRFCNWLEKDPNEYINQKRHY